MSPPVRRKSPELKEIPIFDALPQLGVDYPSSSESDGDEEGTDCENADKIELQAFPDLPPKSLPTPDAGETVSLESDVELKSQASWWSTAVEFVGGWLLWKSRGS